MSSIAGRNEASPSTTAKKPLLLPEQARVAAGVERSGSADKGASSSSSSSCALDVEVKKVSSKHKECALVLCGR